MCVISDVLLMLPSVWIFSAQTEDFANSYFQFHSCVFIAWTELREDADTPLSSHKRVYEKSFCMV